LQTYKNAKDEALVGKYIEKSKLEMAEVKEKLVKVVNICHLRQYK
jgi:hypothetical protein